MRNLLAFVALAVIVVAVVGYYQGWYSIKENAAPDGHHNFSVDVDGKKIQEDVNKVKQEVGEILQKKN